MPIVRSYMCGVCAHHLTVTLTAEQWDEPPPECPRCNVVRGMQQDFKPVAIGGSPQSRARAMADDILANDYHVADIQHEHRREGTPKVRYKDQGPTSPSVWGAAQETLMTAVAAGRETRVNFGSGLDVLQANLKSGAQPDLIEISKRRSGRGF
jgi:hypothetical protein